MAKKNPEQTGQTIRNIKEAFWKLYEEKPIEKISVKQITDMAGYNRATFYLYFSSVRDVRDQIEDDLIAQRDAMLSASMRDGKLAITPELTDVPMTLFRYGRVLLGPHGDPKFVERAENSVWPYIQPILFPDTPNVEDIKDPQERRRLELLKHFYLSGILGIFRAALNNPDLIAPTEVGRFMSEELLPRIVPRDADARENQAAKPNEHAAPIGVDGAGCGSGSRGYATPGQIQHVPSYGQGEQASGDEHPRDRNHVGERGEDQHAQRHAERGERVVQAEHAAGHRLV